MKKIFIIIILLVLHISCKEQNKTDYIINGNAKGVYNGVRVYLKNINEKGQEVYKDTAIVFDERFTMQGKVNEPTVYFLSVDGGQGDLIFMLENNEIDIEINKSNMMSSKVSGSESNEGMLAFQEEINTITEEGRQVMMAYRQVKMPEEIKKRDSLTKVLEEIRNTLTEHPLNFIKSHPDSYFSLSLIGLEANKPKFNVKGFSDAFENLSHNLKTSPKGIDIKKTLDRLYEDYKKIAHLEVGNNAPNFKAPTPDGTIVSLEELKGKVTIIDFWAAWCGPCRRENPNVVKIYNEYHDSGLEIIGVSLDGTPRQKDAKKAWLEAIKKDKLTWHHVSNLNYFNDPIAKLYNINSIPATYILDEEGKIVAKNLRGKALELKVKELLSL